ncbi:hypothetical protein HMI54_009263 [Coelomomyces lativittatus]|nr:hypothetical protein HMI54_009263 [Coelomomyces lativittatus]KAJ1507836.1 hypothetical protein HMI56_007590 [Coelomomyces lativittatus]KAJ1515587.1 hypothetical protein HMI55_003515 [Coelomomyces lativittatus]
MPSSSHSSTSSLNEKILTSLSSASSSSKNVPPSLVSKTFDGSSSLPTTPTFHPMVGPSSSNPSLMTTSSSILSGSELSLFSSDTSLPSSPLPGSSSSSSSSSLNMTTSPMDDLPDPPPLLFSNTHLKPGHKASIMNFTQTLEMYRANASKTHAPEVQLAFIRFLLLAAPQFPNETTRLRQEAVKLAKKVANQGSEEARCVLAECFELGFHHASLKPNYAKAFPLYFHAAKKQDPEAAYRVGVYYEQGRAVAKSFPRAVQFFQKAAVAGHPGAMFRLGMAELHGELGLPLNPRNGVKWLKHSASSATEEHPLALFELAQLHETGIEHVIFVDRDYAIQLYMEAARLGHVPSMVKLGSYYEHGTHVSKDMKLSFQYYLVAAESGHGESMFGIATWYLTGNEEAEVEQSDALAFEWMYKAAQLNLDKAVYAIGHFYEAGIGVPKDLGIAAEWYQKASKNPEFSLTQDSFMMDKLKKKEKENCYIM